MNKKDPNEKISEFIMKNINNYKDDDLDENNKTNIAIKKAVIIGNVQNFVLIY